MTAAQILARRLTRGAAEVTYVNTVNAADRVTIRFVWHPGASGNTIDAFVEDHPTSGARREIRYTWTPDGGRALSRTFLDGTITLPLARGRSGTLTAFGTSWRITREAAGVAMQPAASLRGVQQRLNRLGYHLRAPGASGPGVDGSLGARTEMAVLQFQADYRPAPAAPAAANARLQVRGEWTNNADATYQANLNQYNQGTAVANPSPGDSARLQAALVAVVGA